MSPALEGIKRREDGPMVVPRAHGLSRSRLTYWTYRHRLWHRPYKPEDIRMSTSERHVRLFRNGRNQALRIPREFELEGEEALIHKEGDRLIVEPIRKGKLLALLASLDSLTEPFPDIDDDLPPLDDVQL